MDKATRNRLIAYWRHKGWTLQAIADAVGLQPPRVKVICKQQGVGRPIPDCLTCGEPVTEFTSGRDKTHAGECRRLFRKRLSRDGQRRRRARREAKVFD